MRILKYFLLMFSFLCFFSPTFAQTNFSTFMTPRDLLNSNDSASNISLKNSSGSATTVYGLYVRQYAYVLPGQSCSNATVIYSATRNTTAGAFVMPIVINPGSKAAVGSNYLYNMLFQTIYYDLINSFTPPICALPGCTWGSDTTQYNWCIYLGALAPVATSAGYTANVAPSADLASSPGLYDYNLITNYIDLGPISCNDQTLSCTTVKQQVQAFS